MVKIVEIELGPHFITYYCDEFHAMEKMKRKVYAELMRSYLDLAPVQQLYLNHSPGDDRVYHPFGNPTQTGRAGTRHFHIRTMAHSQTLLGPELNKLLKKHGGVIEEGVPVTNLMTNGLKEGQYRSYPYINTDSVYDYLKSIYLIRTGGI